MIINYHHKMKSASRFFRLFSLILSASFFYIIGSEIYPTPFELDNIFKYISVETGIVISIVGCFACLCGYGLDKLKSACGAFKNIQLEKGDKFGACIISLIGFLLIGFSIAATTYTGKTLIDNLNKSNLQREFLIESIKDNEKLIIEKRSTNVDLKKTNDDLAKSTSKHKDWRTAENLASIEKNQVSIDNLTVLIREEKNKLSTLPDNSSNIFIQKLSLFGYEVRTGFLIAFIFALTIEIIIYTLEHSLSFTRKKLNRDSRSSQLERGVQRKIERKKRTQKRLDYEKMISSVIEENIPLNTRILSRRFKIGSGSADKLRKLLVVRLIDNDEKIEALERPDVVRNDDNVLRLHS